MLLAALLKLWIFICFVAVHRGKLIVSLENLLALSPIAQVVLYTVLSTGEAVADSMNFPIQLCLANKVRNKPSQVYAFLPLFYS